MKRISIALTADSERLLASLGTKYQLAPRATIAKAALEKGLALMGGTEDLQLDEEDLDDDFRA